MGKKLTIKITAGRKDEAQRLVDKYFKDTAGLVVEIKGVHMYEEGNTLYITGLKDAK